MVKRAAPKVKRSRAKPAPAAKPAPLTAQQSAQIAAMMRSMHATAPGPLSSTRGLKDDVLPLLIIVGFFTFILFGAIFDNPPPRHRDAQVAAPPAPPAPAAKPKPRSTSTLRLALRAEPPFEVMHVDLGSKLDAKGRVVANQIAFASEEPFAVSVTAKRAAGKGVSATWYRDDLKLKDERKTFGAGEVSSVGFDVSEVAPWPPGNYRVDLASDAGVFRTLSFRVR
jgi:hypothetical protein